VPRQAASFLSSAATDTSALAASAACRLVSAPGDLAEHMAIRHRVFVEEQRLFRETDRDQRDQDRGTIHVLGLWKGQPAGAVRLYPLDDSGLWKGDRLAVLSEHRQHRLGDFLVRFAVRTAGECGGTRMTAYVQLPNVTFFEQLGWERVGDAIDYVGRPHQRMEIGLSR
jgi:putative N-acetyltransferase (TIGR04045 family)